MNLRLQTARVRFRVYSNFPLAITPESPKIRLYILEKKSEEI
jgi:hypothetical protein